MHQKICSEKNQEGHLNREHQIIWMCQSRIMCCRYTNVSTEHDVLYWNRRDVPLLRSIISLKSTPLQAIRRVWFWSTRCYFDRHGFWLLVTTHVQITLSCGWLPNFLKRIIKWIIWERKSHLPELFINLQCRWSRKFKGSLSEKGAAIYECSSSICSGDYEKRY